MTIWPVASALTTSSAAISPTPTSHCSWPCCAAAERSASRCLAAAGTLVRARRRTIVGRRGGRGNRRRRSPIVTGFFGKGAGVAHDEADATAEDAQAAIAAVLPRWQPLPCVGRAEDIAQAVQFLASDASRLVTGHNLMVDGGISAGWLVAVTRADIRPLPPSLPGEPIGPRRRARRELMAVSMDEESISPFRITRPSAASAAAGQCCRSTSTARSHCISWSIAPVSRYTAKAIRAVADSITPA
jgi:Enoyl-(Acyl carrier protein) reductase